jgi:hypothetical protein
MEEAVISQYTVPVGATPPYGSPAPGKAGKWRKHGQSNAILLAIIVVLILIVACAAWKRKYRAVPHCRRYPGMPGIVCDDLVGKCGPNRPCLNAVAHCMPLVNKATTPGCMDTIRPGDLMSCTSAISEVDPRFTAELITKTTGGAVCLPPEYKNIIADPRSCKATVAAYAALAPLVPYSFEVARALPTCPVPHQ